MHPFLTQLSAITALLVLLNQLWSPASVGHTLGVSAITGLAVYGVLLVGQVTLRYVLMRPEPATEPSSSEQPAAAPEPSATS